MLNHSLGTEYRVVPQAATLELLTSAMPRSRLLSRSARASGFPSFFVSTLEALPRDPASRLPPPPACSLIGVPDFVHLSGVSVEPQRGHSKSQCLRPSV